MKTIHHVEAQLIDPLRGSRPGAREFLSRYERHRTGPTTTFSFEDEKTADDALRLLEKYDIPRNRFYLFELKADEVSTYPAFYFGMISVNELIVNGAVNLRKMGRNDIAMDYHSEQLIVSDRTRAVFEKTTSQVRWHDLPGQGPNKWCALEVVKVIPDPILVLRPIDRGENETPPGTHWVRSDGRDVVTRASASVLGDAGVALSTSVLIEDEVFAWRPRLLISGGMLQALLDVHVTGLLLPHVPLLMDTHPLATSSGGRNRD